MAPACWLCGSVWGEFRKGTIASAHLSIWEKCCPPAAVLVPDTSGPPCMPVVPSKLLPLCWSSDGVSLSKSMCGFFRRNCLGLQQCLLLTLSLLVFAARSFGDLSVWHRKLRLGFLVWVCHSLLSRYPSQIFIHHLWVWGHPVPCVCPSYQSGWMCFFKFHSCQTSIQLNL